MYTYIYTQFSKQISIYIFLYMYVYIYAIYKDICVSGVVGGLASFGGLQTLGCGFGGWRVWGPGACEGV